MIKTILFNYAGVITPTRDNFKFANKYHKRFGMTPTELISKTYLNWDKAAIGLISSDQFWNDIGQELNTEAQELRSLIMNTFPIDPRMMKIIDELKEKFTIVMVSNQIEDWLEQVIDENNLRNKFHHFINSYQVGARKPDKKIFLAALKAANGKPSEALFVDDAQKNIIAAKELGINAIQFQTFEQFVGELKKYTQVGQNII